jgi:hypothetical protein
MKEDEIIVQVQRINSEFYHVLRIYQLRGWKACGNMKIALFAYTQVGTYLLVG